MKKLELRQTLVDFTNEMERILQKNDYKGGWDTCDLHYLENKLIEETVEYFIADCISKNKSKAVLDLIDRIIIQKNQIQVQKEPKREIIDVANVCMMIWDKLTKEDEETKRKEYMKD